jgi:hypothetical protein
MSVIQGAGEKAAEAGRKQSERETNAGGVKPGIPLLKD